MNGVKNISGPETPSPVPAKATRGGESRGLQWGTLWLSHDSCLLWTERMLAALERGNDGKKWHSLIDKVFCPKTLRLALETVTARKGAAGIDEQTTEVVAANAEAEVALLHRLLNQGRYEPKAVRRAWIEKAGGKEKRPLGIPTVRDRIVQTALRAVIEPIFEKDFALHSYGFRPGHSAQQALVVVEASLREGQHWVVDADIKGYFDSIPQDKLLAHISEKIADSSVLALVEKFLRAGVIESCRDWTPTESGTPQGAVISPLLANIYLNSLDHLMAARGYRMVRFADDFIILCRSESEARAALAQVRQWVEEAGLTLHPEKTHVVDATQRGGFEFLGWHFERGLKWPRQKSEQKLKEAIRRQSHRNDGRSLAEIIERINSSVRGWGGYFQGGVRNVPERLEKWIRMRLRSILRKRDKRKGRGRGLDHHRYTNAYFAERGLISLPTITHRTAAGPG
jgi:RNA-directed DNA polymerase